MANLGRPRLPAVRKKELWERWKVGESISDIARALKKPPGSIHGVLKATGGIAPPRRRRPGRALTLAEREEISRGLAAGDSFRMIAARLDRLASTVSREVNRNGGRRNYRALKANERAWERARRPKRCLLAANSGLRDLVAKKLKEDWSPQQISGWLVRRYPNDEAMYVSHETIYRTLFVQARGALKRNSLPICALGGRCVEPGAPLPQVSSAVGSKTPSRSVSARPRPKTGRCPDTGKGTCSPGHATPTSPPWSNAAPGFVMLVRVRGKDTESVVTALGDQIRRLPEAMMGTLTWDRGTEMADHKKLTIATDVEVYFCDPKSPWQRGTSENTNRLLRQYLPKGANLSAHSQHDLDAIALKLNIRPRKTLAYRTPADTLASTVALTG